MRDFIEEALNESYKVGGKTYQFVSGCARRAENFLNGDWYVYVKNEVEMYNATMVDVYFLLYPMGDLKFSKYQAKEDEIISEINSLLKNEGVKGWVIIKSGNFFKTQKFVSFIASRPEVAPDWGTTTLSLLEAVQIIGQVLAMKGFYILTAEIKKQGITVYQAWQPNPSSTDIYELETLMTYSEREDVIDNIVEKVIEKLAQPKEEGGIFGKIESTAKKVIIAAIVVLVVYLLIVYQKPIKMGIEKIEEKVGKSKKKD